MVLGYGISLGQYDDYGLAGLLQFDFPDSSSVRASGMS